MKIKLLFSTILLTTSTYIFGQDFGSIGTQWYYNSSGNGSAPPSSEYIHFKSISDTIIGGVTTHKIERTYYKYNGSEKALKPFYVYEKSNTVFIYNFELSRFKRIYIFNAKKGDTLTLDIPWQTEWRADSTYRLVIDTVENVLTDGVLLKKYKTTGLDKYQFFNQGGSYMDRMGGLNDFFPSIGIIPEANGPLRCFSDSQIDTSFQRVACNYRLVNSIDDSKTEAKVNIYPNPIFETLFIQTEKPVEKIEMTDMTGKQVVVTNQLKVDCNSIENGLYILTVYFKSGELKRQTIIKNAR